MKKRNSDIGRLLFFFAILIASAVLIFYSLVKGKGDSVHHLFRPIIETLGELIALLGGGLVFRKFKRRKTLPEKEG